MMEIKAAQMTAEAYFALPESNLPTQLLHGELLTMPSPEIIHQKLIRRFTRLLENIVDQIGGELFLAPLDVQLDTLNVVQPDLFWVAPDGSCQPNAQNRLQGAPDLVIEVLSPSTARNDRVIKFSLYEAHGVRAYWIVDPQRQYVEVW